MRPICVIAAVFFYSLGLVAAAVEVFDVAATGLVFGLVFTLGVIAAKRNEPK